MPLSDIHRQHKLLSGFLILLASIFIYAIALVIQYLLADYELSAMFISFCAGFILFTPLVSLALHPLLFSAIDRQVKGRTSAMIVNVGLVMLVQGLFFLIWITDAIAIYSIYVDSNSFLAKAFDIKSEAGGDFTTEFYLANVVLAWLFGFLAIVVGLLPCLIARLKNLGIVGNFVGAFRYFKRHKVKVAGQALILAMVVLASLLFIPLTFIIAFPVVLSWIFIDLSKGYLRLD